VVTTTPDSILLEAHQLITGPRNALYGPFPDDYAQTVELFAGLSGHDLDPVEGCLFMVAVKLSRFRSGWAAGLDPADLRDSLTDAAGYIAGAWECAVACSQSPEHQPTP
jgi:hypothetical protein